MTQILVLITLSDSGIVTIKSTPELPKKEMEYVNKWKEEGDFRKLFHFSFKKGCSTYF